jgi:hypothetical protein
MPETTLARIINDMDYQNSIEREQAFEQPRTKSTFMDFIDLIATGLVSPRGYGSGSKTQTGLRRAVPSTETYRAV